MDWDYKNQAQSMYPRNADRWQMGASLTWGMNIQRGTVIATFDRTQGKYLNSNSGNHTAIFLSFYEKQEGLIFKSQVKGMWVIEQGPNFRPRYRQIPFSSSISYMYNANKYNIVEICPELKPPKNR